MNKKITVMVMASFFVCLSGSAYAQKASDRLCTIAESLNALDIDKSGHASVLVWANQQKKPIDKALKALTKQKVQVKKINADTADIKIKCKGSKKPYQFTCKSFSKSSLLKCTGK